MYLAIILVAITVAGIAAFSMKTPSQESELLSLNTLHPTATPTQEPQAPATPTPSPTENPTTTSAPEQYVATVSYSELSNNKVQGNMTVASTQTIVLSITIKSGTDETLAFSPQEFKLYKDSLVIASGPDDQGMIVQPYVAVTSNIVFNIEIGRLGIDFVEFKDYTLNYMFYKLNFVKT